MAIKLFARFSLAFSTFIWGLNVKNSSRIIPTYLTSCFGLSLTPFSFILKFGIFERFPLNYIISVLVALSEILFASSQ